MPKQERNKTDYPGVYFIEGMSAATGKPEKIYYISYWKSGKKVEEKAGRQIEEGMTPARANSIRTARIAGKEVSNRERREALKAEKKRRVWTVSKLWEEYKIVKSPKGIKTDDNRFKNHIESAIGEKQLKEIMPLDVDRIALKMQKDRKPQTVAHVLETIRRVSNFAVNKQICPGLSFKVQMPQFDNKKTEDLTPEELQKLLKVIDEEEENPDVAKMLKLALFTGLRRGEIFRLRWDDIDFQNGFMTLYDTKGGKNHTLPFNPSAREVMESVQRGQSPYIFPGRYGKCRKHCTRQANQIKKKAGLPKDFRIFHGLRHVYASVLASSGQVDMFTLQKLLTHKSPQMVQRYAHLRDEALKKAVNLAGDLVSEIVKKKEDEDAINLEQDRKADPNTDFDSTS